MTSSQDRGVPIEYLFAIFAASVRQVWEVDITSVLHLLTLFNGTHVVLIGIPKVGFRNCSSTQTSELYKEDKGNGGIYPQDIRTVVHDGIFREYKGTRPTA